MVCGIIRRGSLGGMLAGVACVGLALEAIAQTIGPCTTEGTTWLDPGVTNQPGVHRVRAIGTYDCGPSDRGHGCSSGVYEGSCASGHTTAYFVDCRGPCVAGFGNTPEAVRCVDGVGDEVRRGQGFGDCVAGYCTTFASAEDDSFAGVSLGSLEGLLEGSDACEGEGVSESEGISVGISYPNP